MHSSSYDGMREAVRRYIATPGRVVDVGAMDINGCYRPLFGGWEYIGVDIEAGPNVDVVMPQEFTIPIESESADAVISGQCIEHVRNPFKLVTEAARLLKTGAVMILVAPHKQRIHRYPIDTFRYNPDGMAAILEEAGLDVMDAYIVEGSNISDCWGIGRRGNN